MSREVEKDYEKIFQTKVGTSIVEENIVEIGIHRKVTRLTGLRYLEVGSVGHIALNLGLHILYTFLPISGQRF